MNKTRDDFKSITQIIAIFKMNELFRVLIGNNIKQFIVIMI